MQYRIKKNGSVYNVQKQISILFFKLWVYAKEIVPCDIEESSDSSGYRRSKINFSRRKDAEKWIIEEKCKWSHTAYQHCEDMGKWYCPECNISYPKRMTDADILVIP